MLYAADRKWALQRQETRGGAFPVLSRMLAEREVFPFHPRNRRDSSHVPREALRVLPRHTEIRERWVSFRRKGKEPPWWDMTWPPHWLMLPLAKRKMVSFKAKKDEDSFRFHFLQQYNPLGIPEITPDAPPMSTCHLTSRHISYIEIVMIVL